MSNLNRELTKPYAQTIGLRFIEFVDGRWAWRPRPRTQYHEHKEEKGRTMTEWLAGTRSGRGGRDQPNSPTQSPSGDNSSWANWWGCSQRGRHQYEHNKGCPCGNKWAIHNRGLLGIVGEGWVYGMVGSWLVYGSGWPVRPDWRGRGYGRVDQSSHIRPDSVIQA